MNRSNFVLPEMVRFMSKLQRYSIIQFNTASLVDGIIQFNPTSILLDADYGFINKKADQ